MYTPEQIAALKHNNDNNPVDISALEIDGTQPLADRFTRYIDAIKNPYSFQCGKLNITIEYTAGGKTLDELLEAYLAKTAHYSCE